MNQVITIDTFNDNVTKAKILCSSITLSMRSGRLIDRPIVERRVPNWVGSLGKADWLLVLLGKLNFIGTNFDLQAKSSISHSVDFKGWVNTDWNSCDLS